MHEAKRRNSLLEEAEKRNVVPPAFCPWSPTRGIAAAVSALGIAEWRRRVHAESQQLSELFRYLSTLVATPGYHLSHF